VDSEFKIYFDSAIKTLEDSYYHDKKASGSKPINFYNAAIFLEFVTGLKMNYNAVGEYHRDAKAFDSSIKAWKTWYRTNKCLVTGVDIDNFYANFLSLRKEKPDYLKFSNFPEDWRLLFTEEDWGIPDLNTETIYLDTFPN
jgi:hypothetical protein